MGEAVGSGAGTHCLCYVVPFYVVVVCCVVLLCCSVVVVVVLCCDALFYCASVSGAVLPCRGERAAPAGAAV